MRKSIQQLSGSVVFLVAALGALSAAAQPPSYTLFETGQTRPLALSPDGRHLYALNTPDNRLEIFRIRGRRLVNEASVVVGLEPVALAVHSCGEVWVVNHLSDSVSVVDVRDPKRARVIRTLLVGDEPRDIVFAGPGRSRAFITTAHRGQNLRRDPQLTTPGIGRADVWVFDAERRDSSLGGIPLRVLTLFTDSPRALAVSPDGGTVYAAGFFTGNRTTAVNERLVTNGQGVLPPFVTVDDGFATPDIGLVVQFNGANWVDKAGRVFDDAVRHSLPDKDVFVIDANSTHPAEKSSLSGVGTVLFNMAVNPVSGKVYVSNTESLNLTRFEGHNLAGDGTSVRGHNVESRITVIDGARVLPRHLNKHIDFSVDGTPEESEKSLAFPMDMAVTRDGDWLYVAAFGSSKVGVFRTSELEDDTFVPSLDRQIELSGGGPGGLALDEKRGALYVLTRFDNAISIVDLEARQEIAHVPMFNPEPASVRDGRRFLYDARHTSSHGDNACASCHVFGDFDGLAWDLGDPDNVLINNPGPFAVSPDELSTHPTPHYHPLKGPMTTLSLRGMANHGPMHWRGDRTGGNDAPSAQPDSGTFDEAAAFKKFNVAFTGLVGGRSELSDEEMQAFTEFILQIAYPPNPIRNLDNSLTPDQAAGRAFFFNTTPDGKELPSDTFHNCNGCHTLDPRGNAQYGVAKPGFFGTDGRSSFEAESQFFKVPHLRNLYQKVGAFGMAPTFGLPKDTPLARLASVPPPLNDESCQGDQVRGFGFLHDGSVDTIFRFVGANVFVQRQPLNPGGIPADADGVKLRRQLEAFVLAFDSNLAPIVGQQVTLTRDTMDAGGRRVDLLEQRAQAGECDLVARANIHGIALAALYDPVSRKFVMNSKRDPPVSDAILRAAARVAEITFTAAPPGSGVRMALDRDLDGVFDRDEAQKDRNSALARDW